MVLPGTCFILAPCKHSTDDGLERQVKSCGLWAKSWMRGNHTLRQGIIAVYCCQPLLHQRPQLLFGGGKRHLGVCVQCHLQAEAAITKVS